MTLRQHRFGRRSQELTILEDRLEGVSWSKLSRFTFSVRLKDIEPRFDEWKNIALRWYLTALVALVFLGFFFREGWQYLGFSVMAAGIYLAFAGYCVARGLRSSGSYAIVRVTEGWPESIWILRDRPSRQEVDAFLAALIEAAKRARAATLGASMADQSLASRT